MKITYLWHGSHVAHHVSCKVHHQVALPPAQHMGHGIDVAATSCGASTGNHHQINPRKKNLTKGIMTHLTRDIWQQAVTSTATKMRC